LLATAIGACAAGGGRPDVEIRKLVIEGNRAISSREIRRRILTAGPRAWPFARRPAFEPAIWAADLARIERLYEAHGRFDASVEGRVIRVAPRLVDLGVTIREGEPSRVVSIGIRGLEPLGGDAREATGDLPLAVGDVFNESSWDETKRLLRARLRERGHAEASTAGEALIDVDDRTARLALALAPGPRYRFGSVIVRQEDRAVTDPAWISDEVSSAAPEGALYADSALEEAQRRVWQMGVFAAAKVQTGAPDARTARVPVVVDVREAPFRTLRLGGGAGFDQVRQEVRLVAEWSHRNFLGGLRLLKLRAQPGYAFIPGVREALWPPAGENVRHGAVYLVKADLEQPRFLGPRSLRLQAGAESDRQIEQAFTLLAGRGRLGLAWRPWAAFTAAPSYHLEGWRLDAAGLIPAEVIPLALGCAGQPCYAVLSYLQQDLTVERRDNALEPRRGFRTSLLLQEGGGPLGGDFTYARVLVDGRVYVGPAALPALTVAARASVGALFPRGGDPASSPVVQRFYAGGATSMRGFGSRRLSPLLVVPVPGGPSGEAAGLAALPIGGNGLLLGSLEARYQVGAVIVAAFLDAGRVTWARPRLDDVARLAHAVGVGVRYLTPVGPVRLDLAWRLPVGAARDAFFEGGSLDHAEDRSCFGLGGPRGSGLVKEGACVLHLSIGEAF
jgi:translocation and assembly module TamA